VNALQVIADESAAFLAAARLGLDAPVPSCPGWDVRALVGHLARTHRYHAAHLVRGVTAPPTAPSPEPPEDVVPWFEEGVQVLLTALRTTDPQAPAWNWAPHTPQVASFWARRMALETAVHRWDAQAAHGGGQPFAPDVAVDGVDEVLWVHRVADWADEPVTVQGVVAVQLADTGTEHVVRVAPEGLTLAAGAPDAVVQGSAGDVLLALWGRRPLAEHVTGDQALARALVTA
jgi:uncharacterized protein (TIGR03083 family)